jgi:hypothetical protein
MIKWEKKEKSTSETKEYRGETIRYEWEQKRCIETIIRKREGTKICERIYIRKQIALKKFANTDEKKLDMGWYKN